MLYKIILFMIIFYVTNVVNSVKTNKTTSLGQDVAVSMVNCLGQEKTVDCVKENVLQVLNAALENNSTWYLGDLLSLERIPTNNKARVLALHSTSDEIFNKLLNIAQSRTINLKLPKMLALLPQTSASVSNAIDGFISSKPVYAEEGRTKKHKEKNMAMMGGMIIVAMLAQMFLGKVLLIAGAAFVMAKIALVSSLLGSIKKAVPLAIPIPASTAEHVVHYESDHSPHAQHGHGWQRQGI